MIPNLKTRRLHIHAMTAADAGALFAYRSLPEVYRYQGFAPGAVSDAQEFILRSDGRGDSGWQQLGVYMNDTGELTGDCGYRIFDECQAEIGFTVAPASQGRGYAGEAASALLGWLFVERNLHRVIASTDPQNAPSIRVLERLGFRCEGHALRSMRIRGEWVDDLQYALLHDEYTHAR
jgi:aminoglycoside 6'-N-acetyltransferase